MSYLSASTSCSIVNWPSLTPKNRSKLKRLETKDTDTECRTEVVKHFSPFLLVKGPEVTDRMLSPHTAASQ